MRKTYHQLERIVRGFSNHRRIEIIELLQKAPELSVIEICDRLHINMKTGAEHTRRLVLTGLAVKRHDGAAVRHRLTLLDSNVLKFLRTLE